MSSQSVFLLMVNGQIESGVVSGVSYTLSHYKKPQLHCLKWPFSNLNILKTVSNTENFQLGKFLRFLSSLQKCLSESSTTHIEKVRKKNKF